MIDTSLFVGQVFCHKQSNHRSSLVEVTVIELAMAAFEGIAPEYHIELKDRPAMVWDFHSLLLAIQMMFSFMLVDETATLKLCPKCYKAFFSENGDDVYCRNECAMKGQQ